MASLNSKNRRKRELDRKRVREFSEWANRPPIVIKDKEVGIIID